MIAACPQCRSRYRIPRERIAPQGSRLRCAKCSCVFCVQAPPREESPREEAPSPLHGDDAGPPTASGLEPVTMPALRVAPAPAVAPPPPPAALPRGRALVIEPDAAMARRIERLLTRFALDTECITHGGEGLLCVFRNRPDLLVLGGHLEGLASRSFAEIVRRASELRGLRMIRLAAIDEPRGVPEFEADHTLEPGSVPQGLGALLVQMGFEPVAQAAPPPELPAPAPRAAAPAPRPEPAPASPPAPVPAPVAASPRPAPAPAVSEAPTRPSAAPGAAPDATLGTEVAAAERLARIIVSDIILYNEEKFARAVQQGDLVEALRPELDEGLSLFRQRVTERVRAQRDFVIEELERRACARRERSS